MSVTILDGQLARTWKYTHNQRQHLINLYHDTITGVRSAMVNYEEVYGSAGNSNMLMDCAHDINFSIDTGVNGLIRISKDGFFGFEYVCMVQGVCLTEITQEEVTDYEDVFRAQVLETFTAPDEDNGSTVAWYIVESTRLRDGVTTRVHRRFRDFADMNSQIKQNLKGHILFSSIPPLPEKTLKLLVDHNDPQFIQDRVDGLAGYLHLLLTLPQVSDMTCVKGFLGVMEQVREFSVPFNTQTLGLSLENPVCVEAVQKPELCPGVAPGDSISKINGVPVAGLSFGGVINRLKFLPRPMIVHFVRILDNDGPSPSPSTGGGNSNSNGNGNGNSGGSTVSAEDEKDKPLPSVTDEQEI